MSIQGLKMFGGWVLLWVLGNLIIGIRNDLTISESISPISDIILVAILLNLRLIPLYIIAWLIIKFLLRLFGKQEVLVGEHRVRNLIIIWLIIFIPLFLFGFRG